MVDTVLPIGLGITFIVLLFGWFLFTERQDHWRAVDRTREQDRQAIQQGWPSSTFSTPHGAEAQRAAWIKQYQDEIPEARQEQLRARLRGHPDGARHP